MSLWRRQLFLLFLLFLLLLLGWTWWCTDWFQVCGWCLPSYISAIGPGTFIQTKLNGIPWIAVTFLSIGGFVTRCYYSHLNFIGVCQIYMAQECIPIGCVPSASVGGYAWSLLGDMLGNPLPPKKVHHLGRYIQPQKITPPRYCHLVVAARRDLGSGIPTHQ